jgi:hypothetical protein
MTHFINDWVGSPGLNLFPFGQLGSGDSGDPAPGWARALCYTGFGLALLLLGIFLERRRRPVER